MNPNDIAVELARSMFILSIENNRKEPWMFLMNIHDWISKEQQWISMPHNEKEKLIDAAKNYLISLEKDFPMVYDIIINRLIPSNHKSIDYLSHGIKVDV